MKISNDVRSLIVKTLLNNPRMSTYEIAELFGVSQPTVSLIGKAAGVTRPRGPRKGWKQLAAKQGA